MEEPSWKEIKGCFGGRMKTRKIENDFDRMTISVTMKAEGKGARQYTFSYEEIEDNDWTEEKLYAFRVAKEFHNA